MINGVDDAELNVPTSIMTLSPAFIAATTADQPWAWVTVTIAMGLDLLRCGRGSNTGCTSDST